jgi:DNA-binding NarL/FixJ family response regulator
MKQLLVIKGPPSFLRDSLTQVFETDPAMEVRCETANGVHPRPSQADVVILVSSTEARLVSSVGSLRDEYPQAKLMLLLLTEDDALARSALRLGVEGIVDCNAGVAELVECVKQLADEELVLSSQLARRLVHHQAAGEESTNSNHHTQSLTEREMDVLRLLAEGATNRDIATRLSLSEHTVRAHLRVIMQKLQATNRVQAAARAWQDYLPRPTSDDKGEEHGNTRRGR